MPDLALPNSPESAGIVTFLATFSAALRTILRQRLRLLTRACVVLTERVQMVVRVIDSKGG